MTGVQRSLVGALCACGAADAISTWFVLNSPGGAENNPLVAHLITMLGVNAAMLVVLVLPVMYALVLKGAYDRLKSEPRWATLLTSGFVAVLMLSKLIAVVHNIQVLN